MKWETKRLGDVIEKFIDYRGKTPHKVKAGIPLITAKIVKNGFIETPDEFIPEKMYDSWMNRGIPQWGDVFITTEAPLGEIAQVNTRDRIVPGQRIITLHPKKGVLDCNFLKYSLMSPIMQQRIHARASGSTVQGIKNAELQKVEIDLPPFPVQARIGEILRNLDDKIEVNRRINMILERMSIMLFKHWFVDFGFFQEKEFVNSEIGEIPKGWIIGKVGDIGHTINKSADPQNIPPDTPYIGLEHMPRSSIALCEWGTASEVSSNKLQFSEKNFLFGKLRPYFKKVGIAPTNGVCSSDILVIYPKKVEYYGFLLCQLIQDEFIDFTNASSGGTRMPRTTWSQMANYQINIPPDNLIAEFNQIVKPWLDQIVICVLEIKKLSEIRDFILPKLLSGEIEPRQIN